jgi:uncharacterized protein
MNRRALISAAFASAATCATGCGSTRDAPLSKVTIAGGTHEGVYHRLAQAFASEIEARWRIPAEVLTSNESVDNLRLVSEGKATIGFATVDICDLALQGDPPFDGVLPVAALAGVYEDYLQIIYAADRPINKISDLAKYHVSLGPEKSGTGYLAARLVLAAGVKEAMITNRSFWPADHAAAEMAAGNLDAFFMMGGLPTPLVQTLADRMRARGSKIKVLSIPDEAKILLDRYRHVYLQRSIPIGTYGIERAASTVGVGNVIVIHQHAPADVAFRLTELLLACQPKLADAHPEARRLDPRTAVSTFTIPLHPGALRYYRSTKPFPGTT